MSLLKVYLLFKSYPPKNPPHQRSATVITVENNVIQKLYSVFLGSPCFIRLKLNDIARSMIKIICGALIILLFRFPNPV